VGRKQKKDTQKFGGGGGCTKMIFNGNEKNTAEETDSKI